MRIYLHGDRAERTSSYIVTIAPGGDAQFVGTAGHDPKDALWCHPDGTPKQIEVEFKFGAAEVSTQIANYMTARGIAKPSRLLRNVRKLFDSAGRVITGGVFDENGRPVDTEEAA